MSEEKGRQTVKRFFIQGTDELHKKLQHLAIDLNTSAEKLGGELLLELIDKAQAEADAGKRKPKKADR